jgi:hypothetical protein
MPTLKGGQKGQKSPKSNSGRVFGAAFSPNKTMYPTSTFLMGGSFGVNVEN